MASLASQLEVKQSIYRGVGQYSIYLIFILAMIFLLRVKLVQSLTIILLFFQANLAANLIFIS